MATKKIVKQEADSVYFLKILMYLILGMFWLKQNGKAVVPIGLLLGLIFAHQEHFRIDRKVEYAILLVAALLAFAGFGIFVNLR